jgi:hypothetical protein
MSGGPASGETNGALSELERRRARLLAELRRVEALLRAQARDGPDTGGPEPAAEYDPCDTREYLRRFRARSSAPDRSSRDLRD